MQCKRYSLVNGCWRPREKVSMIGYARSSDPRGTARGKKRTGEIGRGGSMTYDVPLHEPSRQPQ